MKSEGSNSAYRWCKRRGLEQQRFYETTKLREQFQDILKVSEGEGGRRREGDVGGDRERERERERDEEREVCV